ncbi:PTS sugar transporter subunit IIB [Enterococcus rivorum]|uniref:PTS mannose transporter subunit IIA n=1 Tax=Enterococcus rivorum TaxID=762845 RepID=A0A1E5KWT4_9ENTE|nr:PTS sugar transporter subunit IIB [Enterococcus rivorum]MBP2099128.1 PTS system galactitol-specific IIB component [Enterococcus rivorum]OEH82278.1 PTS mannose transporter subunit IIA [Enterococcus rivorum]
MARKLIVACGSGVATSTTVAEKIKSKFEADNIDYPVEAVDYKSIMQELPSAAIYVYIAKPDAEVLEEADRLGVSVYAGVPFLTGMGVDEIYENIINETKK